MNSLIFGPENRNHHKQIFLKKNVPIDIPWTQGAIRKKNILRRRPYLQLVLWRPVLQLADLDGTGGGGGRLVAGGGVFPASTAIGDGGGSGGGPSVGNWRRWPPSKIILKIFLHNQISAANTFLEGDDVSGSLDSAVTSLPMSIWLFLTLMIR